MENSYNIEELIDMLDDLMSKATRVPILNKSAVDIDRMSEIITDMRMALPMEIQQAQRVVIDKNNIIAEAKREAEQIIRKAEQRRNEILDQSDITKEAHRRANEYINDVQNRCADIRLSTDSYVDKMLKRVEELMVIDINELRKLRSAIGTAQPGGIQMNPIQPIEKPGE